MDELTILEAVGRYDDSEEMYAQRVYDPTCDEVGYERWQVFGGNWNYQVLVDDNSEIVEIKRSDGQLFKV